LLRGCRPLTKTPGGAKATLLLLLLEGGAFPRGLPAFLLAHGAISLRTTARAELLCRQCAIRLRRTSDVPASRCAYNHLAKRKRRYHYLIRLQRYTGRLCEERNNFVGHHDQYRHEAPFNLPAPKFHRPDTNTQRLTLAFGSMPSSSSGNRIPVEDATTRVPLIIDRSKGPDGSR
jgi:hypothetical protein